MEKERRFKFNSYLIALIIALISLIIFVVFTILVKTVNVQEGVFGKVGFYDFNVNFLVKAGKHKGLYQTSEILGYLALCTCFAYVCLGIFQLIKRKSLKNVDKNLYHIAIYYIVVLLFYFIFEKVSINDRPIYTLKEREPSYPSSHTLLALCLLLVNATELKKYVKNDIAYKVLSYLFLALAIAIVILRAICGVHWATDIIGGVLLSASLIAFFEASKCFFVKEN